MQIDNLSSPSEQFILNSKPTSVPQSPSSFAEQLASSSGTPSDSTSESGTVTLNFHSMTGDQF
jgi:hypothetical protein